jgi:hypothetical protein
MEELGTSSEYLLEIGLEELHKESKVWASRIKLWKRELDFFQKLLDSNASKFESEEDKKAEDHFQNLIIYYNGELLDQFKQSVRRQEKQLGIMLTTNDYADESTFRRKHIQLKEEIDSFDDQFRKTKAEFFQLIESVL